MYKVVADPCEDVAWGSFRGPITTRYLRFLVFPAPSAQPPSGFVALAWIDDLFTGIK